MNKYYTPSGKIGNKAILYSLLLIFIIMPLIGWSYTKVQSWISLIYGRIFITALFMGIISVLVFDPLIRKGKIRNILIFAVLGVLAGLSAYYVSWCTFISDSIGTENGANLLSFISQPNKVFDFMQIYNLLGFQTTSKASNLSYTGNLLYLVWLVEFIMLVIVPVWISRTTTQEPFSELNDDWFVTKKLEKVFTINISDEVLKGSLENANYQSLYDATVTNTEANSYIIATIFDSLGDDDYLSLQRIVAKYDSKGKRTDDKTNIVKYIRIPNNVTEELKQQFA